MVFTHRIQKVLICAILFIVIARSQWKLESPIHNAVNSGVDLILRQEYSRADSLFCEVARKYPDHPAGYLYQAAVMQAYSIDFDVQIQKVVFDSLLDTGRNKAEKLVSPWREYFLGMADGYDAYARIERGDWFGGARRGMASASEFESAIETDSAFYDAYIGIGTYYYWSSRKTAFIRWLPFINDNREEGIRMLIISADNSVYSRFAAISALVSIYLDNEENNNAEKWSQRGLDYYPGNRIFLWGSATALDRQKKYVKAITAYKGLLENIMHSRSPHPYSEIVCRLNLVKSKIALEDTTEVTEQLRIILTFENFAFPENMQSRAQAKLKEARNLLHDLENRQTGLR